MRYDPAVHHRRSIRWRGYDYSQAGAYFVTVCVQDRECVLGEVAEGDLILSPAGEIVLRTWEGLPERFPGVELDAFVVMPNHVHGVLVLGAGAESGLSVGDMAERTGALTAGAMNRTPTLGAVVRAFKAVSTHGIRQGGQCAFAWQRNYYERVIRDEPELERAREYIVGNPLRWEKVGESRES